MPKEKILVIGASGQIGVELTLALRKLYGSSSVVASDLREENPLLHGTGPYVSLDVMNKEMLHNTDLFIGGHTFGNRRKEPGSCLAPEHAKPAERAGYCQRRRANKGVLAEFHCGFRPHLA
jgi:hypothetical protein